MSKAGYVRAMLLAIIGVTAVSLAADGQIDTGKSSIVAVFEQEGVPVEAPFKRFSGRIVYDPAHVAGASASLDVETGSLDLGGDEYNAEVRKKSWFDSTAFPQATFRSTAIKAGAAGRFDATGALSLKGKTQTLTVPVTVKKTADGTAFDGSLVISRAAFGIGDAAWNDVLEDKVTVRFHLVNP